MSTSARKWQLFAGVVLAFCSAQLAVQASEPAAPGAASGGSARRVALLVGIGHYADQAIPSLEGPAHDVAAVRSALLSHWGFREADVQVLLDGAASRAGILAAIRSLESRTDAGDQVFIYFSGHGTSAQDKDSSLPLPHTSGAFIPHDLRTEATPQQMVEQLIVGQRDLRPLLSRLDAGGRRLLVVSDSCYSGQAVRALGARADGARLAPRYVRLGAAPGRVAGTRSLRPPPDPYPYRHVFYIAAASDSEQAMDIRRDDLRVLPTVDGQPHGALTDALVRALTGRLPLDRNHDGVIDQAEVFAAIQGFMTPRGYPHTPQVLPSAAEDADRIARAPLFDTKPQGGPFEAVSRPAGGASAVVPPSPTLPPLRVRLDASATEGRALLPAGVAVVDAGEADFSLRQAAGEWQLLGPAGDLVLQAPAATATASQVTRRLEAALWLRRLVRMTTPQARFTLELQPLPSTRGGTFVEGERFNLALRSERAAHVLLLAVDAHGRVSLLYPYTAREKAAHPADALVFTPPLESPITVTPPFGTDELLAIAFERPPAFWDQLPVRGALPLDHPVLQALEQALSTPGVAIASAGALVRSLPRLP